MYTLKIRNSRGEIYELTHSRHMYSVVNVSGLTMPLVSVNTSPAGTQDGEVYSSSHMNRRNIVITVVLEGDIERSRQMLYTIFPVHDPVTVYYRTNNRDLRIDGYVESVDGSLYEARTSMQVSIVCPDPYFRDGQEITAETDNSGVCVLTNRGDVPVGFTAEVAVSTEDEPTLTETSTRSGTPAEIRAKDAIMKNDAFASLDLSTQTLNITVNGALRTAGTDYTAEIVTRNSDSAKLLWLHMLQGSLVNASVGVEIIRVDTLNLTDMRYWVSQRFVQDTYVTIDNVPAWFDAVNDCIVFAYVDGAVGRAVPTAMEATQKSDGTYSLAVTFGSRVLTNTVELRIYHSMGGTDVHDATIDRWTGGWRFGNCSSYIIDPTMPAYDDSKDILRIYKGDTLLTAGTDYSMIAYTRADSSAMQVFDLLGDNLIDDYIITVVISSIAGDDIRSYTQAQIDAGMCLVDGLTLTNQTTGESMAFPDISFRSGDKIRISTVPGALEATITESTWAEAGTSLVREVLKTGSFFKIRHGINALELSADVNADYVSASFSAQQLFGGV